MSQSKKSEIIYNKKSYQYDLEAEELPQYYHSPGEDVYYKDDNAYYTPGKTYKNIPKPRNIYFSTPITLKKLDDELTIHNTRDKKELEDYLQELEKEAYNLLLFFDEAKILYPEEKNMTVNDKYPYPYYDPTVLNKEIQVRRLKEKIIKVKKELGLKTEVEFYVTIKNSTFPRKSDDIVNHLNESYSVINKKQDEFVPKVINGNMTQLDDVYNIRKDHLTIKEKKTQNPFEDFKDFHIGGYHNQILDYIKKNRDMNTKQEKLTEQTEDKSGNEAFKNDLSSKMETNENVQKRALINNYNYMHNHLKEDILKK